MGALPARIPGSRGVWWCVSWECVSWGTGDLWGLGCAELLLGIRAGLATPHRRDRPPRRGERAIATVRGSKTSGPCGGGAGE